jgi:hypothetical protein
MRGVELQRRMAASEKASSPRPSCSESRSESSRQHIALATVLGTREPRGFVHRQLAQILGCDVRSLALLRVLLATLMLWDCAQQAEDVPRFYGERCDPCCTRLRALRARLSLQVLLLFLTPSLTSPTY